MELIRVQVSPLGNRCGLIVYGKAELTLRLLVLPKMWRGRGHHLPFPGARAKVWEKEKLCLSIIAYEGDFQEVVCPPEWAELLKGCIDCLADRVEKDLLPEKEDPYWGEEAGPPPSFRHLLVRGSRRSPSEVSPSEESAPEKLQEDFEKKIEALIALTIRSGAWKHGPVESSPRDDGLGGFIRESEQHTGDPLRIMAAQFFISEVAARAREVRQGYVETSELLPVIRGRLTARGMTSLAYSGLPLAECTYDDFTAAVPLFRVVVTVLDRVACGSIFPPLLAEVLRSLCGRARSLREALAHIPSLPASSAAFVARQCRLGPLLRAWQPALDVARLLLREDPIELRPTEGAAATHTWVVETPKVWEGILATLAEAAGYSVCQQSNIEAPWGASGTVSVDLKIEKDGVAYLVDAKYKQAGSEQPKPNIADQYQMFAYTHLVSKDDKVSAALVYPALPGTEDHPALPKTKELVRGPRSPASKVKLRVGRTLFPSPVESESDEEWKQYLKKAGKQFANLVKDESADKEDGSVLG